MLLLQLTTKQLQTSFSYILKLGATVADMVDVTKFVGDTSLNNESFVHCVI